MVAAKIPARMTPAARAKMIPCWLMRLAIWIMMVSDSAELPFSMGISPATETL